MYVCRKINNKGNNDSLQLRATCEFKIVGTVHIRTRIFGSFSVHHSHLMLLRFDFFIRFMICQIWVRDQPYAQIQVQVQIRLWVRAQAQVPSYSFRFQCFRFPVSGFRFLSYC